MRSLMVLSLLLTIGSCPAATCSPIIFEPRSELLRSEAQTVSPDTDGRLLLARKKKSSESDNTASENSEAGKNKSSASQKKNSESEKNTGESEKKSTESERAQANSDKSALDADKEKRGLGSFSGNVSWYGIPFHGRKTASGEIFNMNKCSAAHLTLPLPTKALVEDPRTGNAVIVKVNDRGPYVKSRVMDLSREAARELGTMSRGVAFVDVTVLEKPHSHKKTQ